MGCSNDRRHLCLCYTPSLWQRPTIHSCRHPFLYLICTLCLPSARPFIFHLRRSLPHPICSPRLTLTSIRREYIGKSLLQVQCYRPSSKLPSLQRTTLSHHALLVFIHVNHHPIL